MGIILKGGLGFLDKRHCEKTSFVVAGGLGAIFFLFVTGFDFTFEILGYTQGLFSLVIFITVAGYLGVIYYRIANHKKPIFILQFWKAT